MKKIAILSLCITFILFAIIYFRDDNRSDELNPETTIEKLKTIPYLSWIAIDESDKDKAGVTKYDESVSYNGMNIYNSRSRSEAHLMDMNGRILHSWSLKTDGWQHIELHKNGDLFVIIKGLFLMKLDKDSNVIWKNKSQHHHDVDISETGDIYSLTKGVTRINYLFKSIPILDNYLTILDLNGKLKKEISFYKLFREKIPKTRLENIIEVINTTPKEEIKIIDDTCFDIFHSNTVEIIKKDIQGLCKKGDLLVAVRNLDIIAIVDIDDEKMIWSWGEGELEVPHHPSILDNGNILIFDNGGKRKFSRILEVNPVTRKIVWEYKATPPKSFYSGSRGGCQKLPNGNVLITESNKGRVFEITTDGTIVWEFYNPDINEKKNKRATIYRMMRLDKNLAKLFR